MELKLGWQPAISLTADQVARLRARGVTFTSNDPDKLDYCTITDKSLIDLFANYNANHNEPMSIYEIKKIFTDFAENAVDERLSIPIDLEEVDDLEL